MAKRRELETEHKRFIVIALACFKTPSEVARAVKEEFGFDIDRQHVRHYNPEQSKEVADEWIELFNKTRAEFLAQTAKIGAYHQSFRLAELQELYSRVKASNVVLAANLLKQMAEEVGGVYTNKRDLNINPRDALAKLLGVSPNDLPPSDIGDVKQA